MPNLGTIFWDLPDLNLYCEVVSRKIVPQLDWPAEMTVGGEKNVL